MCSPFFYPCTVFLMSLNAYRAATSIPTNAKFPLHIMRNMLPKRKVVVPAPLFSNAFPTSTLASMSAIHSPSAIQSVSAVLGGVDGMMSVAVVATHCTVGSDPSGVVMSVPST